MTSEKRTETSRLQVFDQRGQVVTVDVATDLVRKQRADGTWGDWLPGQRTLSLGGEPLAVVDETTLEVKRTGQRLSTEPPLSGG